MIPIGLALKAARKTWKPLAAVGAGWFIATKTSEEVRKQNTKLILFFGALAVAYMLSRRKKW